MISQTELKNEMSHSLLGNDELQLRLTMEDKTEMLTPLSVIYIFRPNIIVQITVISQFSHHSYL